jgi:hypothetical protein
LDTAKLIILVFRTSNHYATGNQNIQTVERGHKPLYTDDRLALYSRSQWIDSRGELYCLNNLMVTQLVVQTRTTTTD